MSASIETGASTMAAIAVTELGSPPSRVEIPVLQAGAGESLIKVTAAAINPVDLAMASGGFFSSIPPPYVPGVEGCGLVVRSQTLDSGTRVRFAAKLPHGSLAEFSIARDEDLIPAPEGAPDDLVAGLGMVGWVAWLSLRTHASIGAGERVVVLGATGSAGQLAVQLAKIWGAGTVVGAGRDRAVLERLRHMGADSVVVLDGKPRAEVAAAFMRAAGGPLEVILDGLWGDPALAALHAAAPRARFVNFGNSAGPAISLSAAMLRGKGISVVAHNNLYAAPDLPCESSAQMLDLVSTGRLELAREVVAADRIREAWQAVASSAHRKLVVSFVEVGQ